MKIITPIITLIVACTFATASPQILDERWESAFKAWDSGDYVSALKGFDILLKGPDAEHWLDRIALVTGELYQDTELAKDGRLPRFSPSGRLAAYESGARPAVVTHILNVEHQPQKAVDIQGEGMVFAPARATVK